MTETPAEQKAMPHNPEAEAAILAALMLEGDLIDNISARLRVENFYGQANRIIYQAIIDLHLENIPVDLITLAARLKEVKKLDEAGGEAYLAEVAEACPTTAHAPHHARLIIEAAIRRAIIRDTAEIQAGARGAVGMEDLRAKIRSLGDGLDFTGAERPEPINVNGIMADLQKAPAGLATGYPTLDRFVEFNPAELIILASRPSHGKTTLALNLCINMLEQYPERPFIFFSYEMNPEQILVKLIGAITGRQYKPIREEIRRQELNKDTLAALAALEDYGKAKRLYLVNRPRWGVDRISGYCRAVKDDCGEIGAVFVDYIGLVARLEKVDPVEQKYARVSGNLRIAAQELNCPILAISQISREGEKNKKERERYPRLDQMRYSGAVEQEATTVLGLFNQEQDRRKDTEDAQAQEGYGQVETEAQLYLFNLKSRYGPGGGPLPLILKNGNRIEEPPAREIRV